VFGDSKGGGGAKFANSISRWSFHSGGRQGSNNTKKKKKKGGKNPIKPKKEAQKPKHKNRENQRNARPPPTKKQKDSIKGRKANLGRERHQGALRAGGVYHFDFSCLTGKKADKWLEEDQYGSATRGRGQLKRKSRALSLGRFGVRT